MLETAFFFRTLVIGVSNDKSLFWDLPAQSGVRKVEIMVISKYSLKRRSRIPACTRMTEQVFSVPTCRLFHKKLKGIGKITKVV